MDVKVSVIIPTYKRSVDIERALKSVLDQTLDQFEVIIVDDNGIGTEEGQKTAAIVNKYKFDDRVIYIQHDVNKNGAFARNTGIKIARGEFISFLDDDDIYRPERLEKMYQYMCRLDQEWGACYTGYVKHRKQGDQYSAETVSGNVYVQALMRSLYIGSGSNMFFRTSVVKEVGFFNESFIRNQDMEYLIRVLKKYKMAYLDEVLLEMFYDIRQKRYSQEEWDKIEQDFYDSFAPYLQGLSQEEQNKVKCMYSVDELRHAIEYRNWKRTFSILFSGRIPVRVLLKYIKYVANRWKTNTCYGFMF